MSMSRSGKYPKEPQMRGFPLNPSKPKPKRVRSFPMGMDHMLGYMKPYDNLANGLPGHSHLKTRQDVEVVQGLGYDVWANHNLRKRLGVHVPPTKKE